MYIWEEGYVYKRTGVIGGPKRLPDPRPLDWEIHAVVVSHRGAGNQTQFLCQRIVYSEALRHLSSSFFFLIFILICIAGTED